MSNGYGYECGPESGRSFDKAQELETQIGLADRLSSSTVELALGGDVDLADFALDTLHQTRQEISKLKTEILFDDIHASLSDKGLSLPSRVVRGSQAKIVGNTKTKATPIKKFRVGGSAENIKFVKAPVSFRSDYVRTVRARCENPLIRRRPASRSQA